MIVRPPPQLRCELLEDRTTPAVYAVELLSGPLGDHGSSAAYVVDGGLMTNPLHTQNPSGPAWVDAPDEVEAILLGREGLVTVDLDPVGEPLTTYLFAPESVGSGQPFQIVADPNNLPGAQVTQWVIQLEDMAAYPQSDWDYNDTTWTVRVTDYTPSPPPTGPGVITGTVWLDTLRNDQLDPPATASQPGDGRKADTRVTLVDASGNAFATTYADANGQYAFSNLPLGTYYVLVSRWGIETFVTQGPSYSMSTTDSDVDGAG